MADDFFPADYEGSTQIRADNFALRMGISEISYPQIVEDAVAHAAAPGRGAPPVADQPWVSVGPRNVSGRITALAQDPTNKLTLYAGSAHGGLWRTIDGGDTWGHLGQAEHNFPIAAIAIPHQTPRVLYVGSGSAHSAYASGRGIYEVSVPGPRAPAVFRRLVTPEPGSVAPSAARNGWSLRYTRIRMDPDDPSRLWAASQSGLWRAELRAAPLLPNWVQDFPGPIASGATAPAFPAASPYINGAWGPYASDVLVARDPRDRTMVDGPSPGTKIQRYLIVYVAIDGQGVYRGRFDRTNTSMTWERQLQVPNPALGPGFGRIQLALCERRPERVYALFATPGVNPFGNADQIPSPVYRSSDNGDTWQAGASSAPGAQSDYDLILEVSPDNPSVLVAGSLDVYKSEDGGNSWTQILDWVDNLDFGDYGQHADQHALMFDHSDRRKIWVGNDGGLTMAQDLRRTRTPNDFWRLRSHGIAAGQFQYIDAGSTAMPFMAGGGLQDNGSWVGYGGPTWSHVGWADGAGIAVDSANARRYYVAQNSGHSIYAIAPAVPAPSVVHFNVADLPQSLAPLNAMGSRRVQVMGAPAIPLVDNGANSPFVPVLLQHPVNAGQLLIGWQQGLAGASAYSSMNGGVTVVALQMANLAPPPATIPIPFPVGAFVTGACFGPVIPGVANVEGWIGLSTGALFRSGNAPAGLWAGPPTALPWPGGVAQQVSDIVVHPTDDRIVAVASSGSPGRVFLTFDRGRTWQDLTERTPTALAVTPATPNIPIGQARQFTARATYADGSTLDVTARATWSTTNAAQASFSATAGQEGQLTANALGSPTVNVSFQGQAASTVVTVVAAAGPGPALPITPRAIDNTSLPPCPMTSLEFDRTTPTRLFVGTLAGVYVLNSVASPVAPLTIAPGGPVGFPLGHARQLTATVAYSDGTPRDVTREVDWSAAPGGIVTLGNTPATAGQITGVAVGATTITARRGTLTVNVAVNVTAAAPGAAPLPAAPATANPTVAIGWRPYAQGLPLTLVNDLVHVPGRNVLRAGTFGRGIWECDLAARPASRLYVRQTITEDGVAYPRPFPPPLVDDPRVPAATVAIDHTHAFDIRVDAPPYTFLEDRVDGVEFDERLPVDTVVPLAENFIYVQVHNSGSSPVTDAEVHLYFMDSPVAAPAGAAAVPIPALGPIAQFYNPPSFDPTAAVGVVGSNWQRVAPKVTLPPVAPGEPVVARFRWIPPAVMAGKNIALLALCTSPAGGQDPLPPAGAGPNVSNLVPAERRAALRIVASAPAPAPSVFIRDGVDDDGRLGSVAPGARSPDIIVGPAAPADPAVAYRDLLQLRSQSKLVGGTVNNIYVRIHNRGVDPVTAEYELWAVPLNADGTPAFATAGWVRLTAAPPPAASLLVAGGGRALAHVTWTPPDPNPAGPLKGYILVAILQSQGGVDVLPDRTFVTSLDTFWDFLRVHRDAENAASRAFLWTP
ncbi:MAG TPA: hypothetical protein VJ997_13875 [Longimicrobiales bacterium]|nr:hypothetical protein [Longimicrobiales bacterium]